MKSKVSRRIDTQNLLEGPLLPKIIAFVLPLMLTNLLQMLYSAADMVIVGMSDVDGALGAIGTTSAMIHMILNIFMGFSVGASVVVARSIGKEDRITTKKSVHTSLIIAAVMGLTGLAIGMLICRPLLLLLGAQGHILDLATLYTRIYFIGMPFLALANYMIAILRAAGDTKTPLYILTFTGLLNVILNLFFVLVCRMSVDGVALATLIANAVSMVLLAFRLHNDESWIRFDFRDLHIDKTALAEIIRIGLPSGIQGALFSLSNMVIQSSVITLNNIVCPGRSDIIDGTAAAASIDSFAYVAVNAVTQAAITFTSQHYGAKDFPRLRRVIRTCTGVSVGTAVIVSAWILLLRYPLSALYVSTPLAIETSIYRLIYTIAPYFLLALMDTGSGFLRGLGSSLTSTIISLTGACLLRILWISIMFNRVSTLFMIFVSYPISWGITGFALLIATAIVLRRLQKQHEAETEGV